MIEAHPAHPRFDGRRHPEHSQEALPPYAAVELTAAPQPTQRPLDRRDVVALRLLDEAPRDRGERPVLLDKRRQQVAPGQARGLP